MKSKNLIIQFRPSRFWSNVQALRVDAGLTEKDLSLYVGASENYITNAIKNGGVPNIAVALSLAQTFDTTTEELAFGAVGLEIRKKQLEAELERIVEEIEDARKDIGGDK